LQLIADPWFWAIAIPAVVLTGISKAGLGGGAGGVAAPLMSLVIPPPQAAAIVLVILLTMDLAAFRPYMWKWDVRILRVIVPAGLIGCVIGTAAFRHMDDNWIRILVGSVALGFLLYSALPRKNLMSKPSGGAGWFWGTLSGFTSFITHSGGPPLMVYLLPQRLDKAAFIATSLVFFAALNWAKIGPYLWLGLFDARNLATSAALIPAGIAGIYLGVWLQTRIQTRWFYRLIYVLLFVTGTKLLYEGITGL
jgi:uncharacterized membrane protein YfcA